MPNRQTWMSASVMYIQIMFINRQNAPHRWHFTADWLWHEYHYMITSALSCTQLLPVAARTKTQVWSRLTSGIVGSNPADGMEVRLLHLLCVVKVAAFMPRWSLAQRSPTGDMCLCHTRRPRPDVGCSATEERVTNALCLCCNCIAVWWSAKCLYNIFRGIRKNWKLGHQWISKPPSPLFNGHWGSLSEVKWQESKADRTSPPSTVVKSKCSQSLLPLYAFI